jgi:hypothetical protein
MRALARLGLHVDHDTAGDAKAFANGAGRQAEHAVLTVLTEEPAAALLQFADHRVGIATEGQGLADRRLTAEERGRQAGANDGDARAGAIFERRERAPTRKLRADDVEEGGRHALDEHRV